MLRRWRWRVDVRPRRDFVSRRRRRWEISGGCGWGWRAGPTRGRRLRGRRRRWRRLDKGTWSLSWLRRRRSGGLRLQCRARWRASAAAALGLATIEWLSRIRRTLLSRPLPTLTRNTILPPIKHGGAAEFTALRRRAGEVIEGVSKVLQPRQLANGGGHLPGEAVVGHIQLLQTPHAADLRRQRPLQVIEAHVKHRELLEPPNLRRQAPRQIIVHQNQLVQRLPHLPNAAGNAAAEVVVRQNQHRNRRVPQILRDAEPESVVVQKQRVQLLIKQLRRHAAFELIEPEVQEFQRRQPQHHLRKPAGEPVVAHIQFEKQLQFLEAIGDDAAESVRVDVEEGEIGQQPQLVRQVPGDIAVVEINARHHPRGGVG